MNVTSPPSALLTTREAARRLQLSPGTLQNWRNKGHGPAYVRLKGKSDRGRGAIRYTEVDLECFISQSRTTPR